MSQQVILFYILLFSVFEILVFGVTRPVCKTFGCFVRCFCMFLLSRCSFFFSFFWNCCLIVVWIIVHISILSFFVFYLFFFFCLFCIVFLSTMFCVYFCFVLSTLCVFIFEYVLYCLLFFIFLPFAFYLSFVFFFCFFLVWWYLTFVFICFVYFSELEWCYNVWKKTTNKINEVNDKKKGNVSVIGA